MKKRHIFAASFALSLLGSVNVQAQEEEVVFGRPKLVVVISVDQLSGNLFAQYRGRFTSGLKALSDEGVVYPNGFQVHAATETCPGHSTLLTGRSPYATGIVANTWYDRSTGKDVYCVAVPENKIAGIKDAKGRGPNRLLASTLGDWLKDASPDNRVYSISGKDRAAIMMGGHKSDGSYWWEDGFGFTTYLTAGADEKAKLAPVEEFNKTAFEQFVTKPPVWIYNDVACQSLARQVTTGDVKWSSQLPPTGWQPSAKTDYRIDKMSFNYIRYSPMIDQLTTEATKVLIDKLKLGKGRGIDLLNVSLSATDTIAHRYGTQGPEMCDQMSRLDFEIDQIISAVYKLGVPYLIVLSADHGGSDYPERYVERGNSRPHRIDPRAWLDGVNKRVQAQLKLNFAPLTAADGGRDIQQISIVDAQGKGLGNPGLRQRIMTAALRDIRAQKDVAFADSATNVAAAKSDPALPIDQMPLIQRYKAGLYPQRSGDILVALQSYVTPGVPKAPGDIVETHGSPYDYDRRVPIIYYFTGIPAQERPYPVSTTDIAPTIAYALGLKIPDKLDGSCRPLVNFSGVSPCNTGPK